MGSANSLTKIIFNGKSHYKSSGYGKRSVIKTSSGTSSTFHKGVDYATVGVKLPQYAVAEGTVFSCGTDSTGGKYVWIKYPSLGVRMLHYHLDSYCVKSKQKVVRGTQIGVTGQSGKATGIHLHLEMRRLSDNESINPEKWISEQWPKYKDSSSSSSSKSSKSTNTTKSKVEKKTVKKDVEISDAQTYDFALTKNISSDFAVRIKKAANNKSVYDITKLVTSATWSGSVNQASRSFEFTYVRDANDEDFSNFIVENGDAVGFYFGGKLKYLGFVNSVALGAGNTEVSVSSNDVLSLLISDTVCFNFKNLTATQITKKICRQVGIECGTLPKCKKSIEKFILDNETAYNGIIQAYYKEYKATKIKYIPVADQTKLKVIQKGEDSGVKLKLGENVINTSVEISTDEVINRVVYYDENGIRAGVIDDKESQKKYGVRQTTYQKEGKTDVKIGARALIHGVSQSVSVEALGSITAIAGRSIKLYDNSSGLEGKFWIESDSHSFTSGEYTMSLTLSFRNMMEGQETKSDLPKATGSHYAYYSQSGKCYHSKNNCGGANLPIRTTVKEAEKIRAKCSRCWSKEQ